MESTSEPGTGPAQLSPSQAGKGVEQGSQTGIPERGLPSPTLHVLSQRNSMEVWPNADLWDGGLSHPAGAQGGQQGASDNPRWKIKIVANICYMLTIVRPCASPSAPSAQSCGMDGFHPALFLCLLWIILDRKVPQLSVPLLPHPARTTPSVGDTISSTSFGKPLFTVSKASRRWDGSCLTPRPRTPWISFFLQVQDTHLNNPVAPNLALAASTLPFYTPQSGRRVLKPRVVGGEAARECRMRSGKKTSSAHRLALPPPGRRAGESPAARITAEPKKWASLPRPPSSPRATRRACAEEGSAHGACAAVTPAIY